ncbi:MAG: septum formation initiator family protein [Sphingobacteriales bacterium]|nr:MAG: septum formation initiator family protein [Sphingobacteriales bacterium]
MPGWLKNRYVLTTLLFLIWMLFFDGNTFLSQIKMRMEIKEMKGIQDFYRAEILKSNSELKELLTNNATLEKFAREHYLMKRPEEDVFIIVKE